MWNIEFQFFVVDVCYYEHIYFFQYILEYILK